MRSEITLDEENESMENKALLLATTAILDHYKLHGYVAWEPDYVENAAMEVVDTQPGSEKRYWSN